MDMYTLSFNQDRNATFLESGSLSDKHIHTSFVRSNVPRLRGDVVKQQNPKQGSLSECCLVVIIVSSTISA